MGYTVRYDRINNDPKSIYEFNPPKGGSAQQKASIVMNNSAIEDSIIENTDRTIAISSGTKITGLDYDDIFKHIAERFNKIPTIEHKCHNCGGTLTMNENQHIFNCPYCNSVYAIGVSQIYGT